MSAQKREDKSRATLDEERAWWAASALRWCGHLPGSQGSVGHSWKPPALGHYQLTAASKECVPRPEVPASPELSLSLS